MTPRVLLADDDPGILDVVSYAFEQAGFAVASVADGDAALAAARAEPFDVLVLDVMMPGLSGTDVCRIVRAESDVPILLLTARDAELDRVLGLELGADDYVTKPFSLAELTSRVRAILRRRELDRVATNPPVRRIGSVELDFVRHLVSVGGTPVQLTPSEFKVLSLLAEQPERVFSRRQIMEHLWQTPYVGDDHACDVHISNLRRKLDGAEDGSEHIVTVRGVGYKFVP